MDNPFVIGDPVRTLQPPHKLGKVVHVVEGTQRWEPLVTVQMVGQKYDTIYCLDELCVCNCAERIPKGVSQCQTPSH